MIMAKSKAEGDHYSTLPALFGFAWSENNAALHPIILLLKERFYELLVLQTVTLLYVFIRTCQ